MVSGLDQNLSLQGGRLMIGAPAQATLVPHFDPVLFSQPGISPQAERGRNEARTLSQTRHSAGKSRRFKSCPCARLSIFFL